MAASPTRPESAVARHVLEVLDPLVGRFTARKATELVAQQCGATLDSLRPQDVPDLCDRLRPMLRTLLGKATAESVLANIARPFGTQIG
jgi:hypothetical protein